MLGGQTLLELIEPRAPESSAGKLVARTGEGWHLLSVDLEPVERDTVERYLSGAGISIVTDDLDAARRRCKSLGFGFGPAWDDDGDTVRQAEPRGRLFLQLRAPTGVRAPSHAWLKHFGPGLFNQRRDHMRCSDGASSSEASPAPVC
jgi:hypothetical protein